MMTLNRLRLYYVTLVLADHLVWFGLSLASGLVWQVSAVLEVPRVLLFGLALLPARFRLWQVRAIRWVSGLYFLTGAAAAWLAHVCTDADTAVALYGLLAVHAEPAAVGQSAWLLSVYAVLVLIVNARMIPRLRYV